MADALRRIGMCLVFSGFLAGLSQPAFAVGPPAFAVGPEDDDLLPPGSKVPDKYIVVLHDWAVDIDGVADDIAIRTGGSVQHVYRTALKGFVIKLPAGISPGNILRHGHVAFVEQDTIATHFDHVVSEIPTGVNRIHAQLNPTTSAGAAWGVAVIDTGIQLNHPDLHVVGNVSFVRKARNGNDDNGHGTHVAGIIGALDNGQGVVGVIPGAALYAVKVLNSTGSGSWSDIVKGIDWVTQNASKIAVVNMSLGGGLTNADDGNCGNTNGDAVHKAICGSVKAGIVYVVAAGNSFTNVKDFRPAAYREVVTVSAMADSNGQPNGGGPATLYGQDDMFATFSNFGGGVDVIAPGVNITSTCVGSSYCAKSGTSMASPHAAGAIALWIARHTRPATANANDPTFRTGILDQISEAVGQFRGDPDGIAERMLNADSLGTGGTSSSICCPAP
jgi:subtilisin